MKFLEIVLDNFRLLQPAFYEMRHSRRHVSFAKALPFSQLGSMQA